MKKLIALILTIATLLSFSSCSFIREVRSNIIKKQILAGFTSSDTLGVSEESGSFNALFEPFLQDFIVAEIENDNELKYIWKKGNLLTLEYVSLKGSVYLFYSPTKEKAYQYYYVGERLSRLGSSDVEEDPTTIFSAFGVDIDAFYHPSDSTESTEQPTLRDMTADDLTISDDYKTCYISEDYIKELAKTSYVTDELYSEKELERYFEGFTGSGALKIEEKTLEISFSSTGENAPKMAVDMIFTFAEDESMDAVITVKSEQAIDGQIVPMEITMRINDFHTVEGKPVKMDMEVTTEFQYNVEDSGTTMEISKTDVCKIDISDETKPQLLLKSKQSSKLIEPGVPVQTSTSEVYFEIDTQKSEDQLVYRTTTDLIVDVEIFADHVAFGDHEKVAPERVRTQYSTDTK